MWGLYWLTHVIAVSAIAAAPRVSPSSALRRIPVLNMMILAMRAIGAYGKVLPHQRRSVEASSRKGRCGRFLEIVESATLPKRWFFVFYIVGVCVNSWLLLRPFLFKAKNVGLCPWLFEIHVIRRLCESLLVTKSSSAARMHIVHLVIGVSYYVAVPLTILHCSSGGGVLKYRRGEDVLAPWWFPRTLTKDRYSLAAFFLFFFLNYEQSDCHRILANLRRPSGQSKRHQSTNDVPIQRPYSIPRGSWFALVSCPHYLAEIFIYLSLTILCQRRRPMLMLVLFVAIELGFSAVSQHDWYKRAFRDYPKKRKAIIPFLL